MAVATVRRTAGTSLPVRSIVIGASALSALGYFLIGVGVLRVAEAQVTADLLAFGVATAAVFAVGTLVVARAVRRWPLALFGLFQTMAIAMYVVVAPERTPPYEPWGIVLKVLQVAILLGVLTLLRRPRPAARISP